MPAPTVAGARQGTVLMSDSGMPRFANLRVILALMLREMTTRYGKSAGGYFWAFAEPLGMIAILSVVFGFMLRSPSLGTVFPLFFATGHLTFGFYADMTSFSASAINTNKALLTYPRVTPMDAIIARCLLQFATLIVVAFLILAGLIIAYDVNTIYDFRSMIKAVLLNSLLGMGTGVMNAYIFSVIPTYRNVWKIITRPLFLISGIFFIMEDLPRAGQDVLWWNPIIHSTALMRKGFYPEYEATFVTELYPFTIGFVLLSLGLFLIHRNRTALVEEQ